MSAAASKVANTTGNGGNNPDTTRFRNRMGPYPQQEKFGAVIPDIRNMREYSATNIYALAEAYINDSKELVKDADKGIDRIIEILDRLDMNDLCRLMTSASRTEHCMISCSGGISTITTVFAQIFMHWWDENALFWKPDNEKKERNGRIARLLDALMELFDRKGLTAEQQLRILNTEMQLKKMTVVEWSEEYEEKGSKAFPELLSGDLYNYVHWPELAEALKSHQNRLLDRIKRMS